jgi:hypothetical protein
MKLAFGLGYAVPETAVAAWGCRAIVKQTGDVDVLWDRQDLQGTDDGKAALKAWINAGPFKAWQNVATALLRAHEMQTRESKQFVLYEDAAGIIVGDTHASAGYLYVAAWLKA